MTEQDVIEDVKRTAEAWEPSWEQRIKSANVDYDIRVELANSSQVSSIAEAERIRQDSYRNVETKRAEKIKKLCDNAEKRLMAMAEGSDKPYDARPLNTVEQQLLSRKLDYDPE